MYIFGKKKDNVIEPTLTQEQLSKIRESVIHLQPNNDIEFITPPFSARKYYKHLKRMMWKHY